MMTLEQMNTQPEIRIHPVTKKPIHFYSLQQIEQIVPPEKRLVAQRDGSMSVCKCHPMSGLHTNHTPYGL